MFQVDHVRPVLVEGATLSGANPTTSKTGSVSIGKSSQYLQELHEKVWACLQEISATGPRSGSKGSRWAADQEAILPQRQPKDKNKVIKTLINSFKYPRKGPGQMWEAARRRPGRSVARLRWAAKSWAANTTTPLDLEDAYQISRECARAESSMSFIRPEREIVNGLQPAVSDQASMRERLKIATFSP